MSVDHRIAAIAFGLFASFMAWYANAQSAGNEQKLTFPNYEETPQAEVSRGDGQLRKPFSGIPVTIVETPDEVQRADIRQAKSDKYDAEDLAAQRQAAQAADRSAAAAEWMKKPTWIQIGIGLATVAGLFYTLHLTRKSTRIAEEAVAETQKNNRLELRAYLAVEPLGIKNLIRRDKGIGLVQIRNVGRLPARDVSAIVHMTVCDRDKWMGFAEVHGEISSRTIHPGATMSQGSVDYHPVSDICSGDTHVFVWGQVHYLDGYGIERFTRFCHRYAGASYEGGVSKSEPSAKGLFLITAEKARYHTSGYEAS